ncbi:hypothetical protein CDEST_10604 [Colletotrichum destructivum]|uniref:Major facilitator superfamily transporter n=1 Tax=Colletotrichum destructivum TaxID=34406 RepID=A0AAX4IQV7_9PEZI|nr:hypothetical protein CDEST_10604 [Colletotrichum destructivum]
MPVLLSTLGAAIVIMSLVSIRDAFHDFELRHWVVTLYLLTYADVQTRRLTPGSGVPVIFVQLSDILGRKFFLLSTLAVVAMFSIVCSVVLSTVQLQAGSSRRDLFSGCDPGQRCGHLVELIPPDN